MNKNINYTQLYKDLEQAIHEYRRKNYAIKREPMKPTLILIHPETMINMVIAINADLHWGRPTLGCSIMRNQETGRYSILDIRIIQTFDIEPNTFELI